MAWRNWYHCMGNTYGTWLPGDPRGWRTKGHRRHIEGDYRNPPPEGVGDRLHKHSKRLLKRDPVFLSSEARIAACRLFAEAMCFHDIELVELCVSAMHFHLLARFVPVGGEAPRLQSGGFVQDPPRHFIGIAKKESARELARRNLVPPGGVWARRGKIKPIHDRAHQVRVVNYIKDHATQGAAVWSVILADEA